MFSATWRIEDPPPSSGGRQGPQLVSLRFLIDTLRRRWRVWVGGGIVGFLLGAAYVVMMPAASVGTVTLMLAHEDGTDPAVAMSTDVSLLRTRTVANAVTERLDLPMTPEQFQRTVVALPVTTQILQLDVSAASDRVAQERARVLAQAFLDFRTSQLRSRTDAEVREYQSRVDTLATQVALLTKEYDGLVASGNATEAAAALTQRSEASSQIGTLREQIDDANLRADALVEASHVVDSPAVVPRSALKRTVLVVGSATVGGLAVGAALVVFFALTSDKLRRRDEVALALGLPVRASARSVHRGRLPRLPWRKKDPDLAVLAHALSTAIPEESDDGPRRLAVASIDNIEDAELLTATLAADLSAQGETVLLVDLGDHGGLSQRLVQALRRTEESGLATAPTVLRPDGVPQLATGPYGVPAGTTGIVADDDPRRRAWDEADVVLVLTSIRLGSELELLSTWADDAVVLVTAGRSSAERLRTTTELLRSAGLALPFALMLSSDEYDESLGLPDQPDTGEGNARKAAQ